MANRRVLTLGKPQGVALVLVLWVTVLLTIMAGAFTLTIQREAKLIGNLKGRSEANALAEAGLQYAMLMLSVNDPKQVWKADWDEHELPFYNGLVKVRIGDERGKIDLNLARRDLLLKMFAVTGLELGAAEKLTDAILDWRDKNDVVDANGAEQKDYKQNNLPYVPRNGPFQSIEELQFVLGMTPQLFKAVEPMLTVYSHTAAVDKTKAPDEVLKVLDAMTKDGASEQGAPTDSETGAQQPATDSETDAQTQTDDETLAEGGDGTVAESGDSGTYSIYAAATLPSGHSGQIRILVRRDGPATFNILSWKYVTAQNNLFARDNFSEERPYFN